MGEENLPRVSDAPQLLSARCWVLTTQFLRWLGGFKAFHSSEMMLITSSAND